MKKKLFLFFIFSLVLILLASCGSQVELKTMSMFGGTDPHVEIYEELLKEFEEEHGIKISDSSATSDEAWKASVVASFKSGDQPDVLFFFTGNTAAPLVENGYVVSIETIRKEYPNYAKNISNTVLDPYAVPLKGFVEGVFVNTELFTDDLAPYLEKDVWTWQEYTEIANKLKAKGKIPFALGAIDVPHYWIEHLVLGVVGPEAFGDVKKSLNNNEADWIKALKLLNTLAEDGWFGDLKGNQKHDAAETSFKEGDAAMILDGSWFAGGFNEESKVKPSKMKMMPFPAIPTDKGGSNKIYMQSGFTSGFYITTKAWENPKTRELAVKLVEKMTSTEAITKFVSVGGVPADSSVKIANANALQVSMNSMPARTVGATLPLSDSAKANTFGKLVAASNAYLTANDAEIKKALKEFKDAQE